MARPSDRRSIDQPAVNWLTLRQSCFRIESAYRSEGREPRGPWAPPARFCAPVETALGTRAKRRVYVDGQPGREYDVLNPAHLQDSPDGRHVIYVAHRLKEASREVSFVVIDRAEGKRYDAVLPATLSVVEGRALTYVARAGRRYLRVLQPLE